MQMWTVASVSCLRLEVLLGNGGGEPNHLGDLEDREVLKTFRCCLEGVVGRKIDSIVLNSLCYGWKKVVCFKKNFRPSANLSTTTSSDGNHRRWQVRRN